MAHKWIKWRIALRLLRNQDGQFLGGFFQGLNQGIQNAQEAARRREELDLRKQQIQAQQKQLELDQKLKEHEFKQTLNQMQGRDMLQQVLLGEGLPAQTPQQHQAAAQAQAPSGDDFQDAFNAGGLETRQARPQDIQALRIQAGEPIQSVFKAQTGNMSLNQLAAQLYASGNPEGAKAVMEIARAGSGGTPSAAFASYQEALAFKNSPDFQAAFPTGAVLKQTSRGWQWEGKMPISAADFTFHSDVASGKSLPQALQSRSGVVNQSAQAGAGGAVIGRAKAQMGVPVPGEGAAPIPQGTTPQGQPSSGVPLPQQAETAMEEAKVQGQALPAGAADKISQLDALLNTTLPMIEANYSDKHIGPVIGLETAFALRRSVGSKFGAQVSTQEATFRTALKDAGDILLRARSGAQINEQEYNRLSSILPKPTDEPQVFKAALKRFKEELKAVREAKIRNLTTPRGKLNPTQAPAASGSAPRIISIEPMR